MTTPRRDYKTTAVVLRKTPYRETSLIVELFSKHLGRVSVIAKGARREKRTESGLLDILNELDLVLHRNPNSSMFVLTSANLIHSWYREIDFKNGLLLQACIEVFRQLETQKDDISVLYELMIRYFRYIHKKRKNGIAVFWRLLLRILSIYGIDIDLAKCLKCGKSEVDFAAFYPLKNGFICTDCYVPAYHQTTFQISKQTTELLSKINFIGNILEDIEISDKTIKQINKIFLLHLAEHLQQNFHLKSLELYSS